MTLNSFLGTFAASCLFIQIAWIQFLRTPKGLQLFSDVPNERSSHAVTTPRGGGIVFSFVIIAALIAMHFMAQGVQSNSVFSLLAFLLLAMVGLLDDMTGLSARSRFMCHFMCAALVAWSAVTYFGAPKDLTFFMIFASLIFYGAMAINFFNFADGINGYIGVMGVWLCWLESNHHPLLVAGLLPALLCFLYYNVVKRQVFMGDVGSTSLGLFVLYILPGQFLEAGHLNLVSTPEKIYTALLLNIASWWVVWIDCGTMVLAKIRLRFPLAQAHREHIYQRTARQLKSHVKTTVIFVAVQGISYSILILLIKHFQLLTSTLVTFFVFLPTFIFCMRSNYKALKSKMAGASGP